MKKYFYCNGRVKEGPITIQNKVDESPLIESVNQSSQTNKTYVPSKQGMFSRIFSFEGRIRRTEFSISLIIFYALHYIVYYVSIYQIGNVFFYICATIPIFWFLFAQSAKRCHDLGNSGWFQIIPFYVLWMLFADSDIGTNEYGHNPKE